MHSQVGSGEDASVSDKTLLQIHLRAVRGAEEEDSMKKQLFKKGYKILQTVTSYDACTCGCVCSGCASVPSTDYLNVKENSASGNFYPEFV
jgi:hypothetical protein